ncbi:intermembrane transport protein PqiB [Photobacterium alginatilyticum]|uniref:Intermembrane transport protein PqiB n=1 Tax=Photobacterium alginatilyticum TaxID=1775171 RepID=A0ABW9YTV9_9GAMM|nr:intermembrane transport protein PqiB [Photobacterium alginatilyticum]NBI55999.1 intermembrane transport protein PqiB [Photobacterium alginatilyticum]
MSDNKQEKAEVQDIKQISSIWLVPVIALAIGIWMLAQYMMSKGPEVTLLLSTAEGIEIGKTEVKALNVRVGIITDVSLNDDYSAIIATAQIDKDAARMLKEDTLFWVVKPRIGKEGVSGLETLLSGAYVQLQPGVKDKEKLEFTVLEVPPVAPPDAKGIRLVLYHNEAGKLGVGDPVLYEGFTVGRVEKVTFDPEAKKANYQLFIFEPYNSLIRKRTRFWLTSGVDLQMSAEGFNFKIGSIESLITGGVSFRVPRGNEPGELITQELSRFRLYNNLKQVRERFFDEYLEYVMLFDESVRGLNSGAPVEYRGIRIGTVRKVPLELPRAVSGFASKQIPVLVRIELGRIYEHVDVDSLPQLKENLEREFKAGLRASLKTGNLLTGALLVDTELYPEEPLPELPRYGKYDVFPTKAGGFAQIQKQISAILSKINNLPVEDTLASLNNSLNASQKTLLATEKMANELAVILANQDTQAIPSEVRNSLQQIQNTLDGFGPDAEPYRNLEQALSRFEQVMTELQPVLRQINDKPNSLIFSGEKAKDPIPVGGIK